jgi:hypothetical protein
MSRLNGKEQKTQARTRRQARRVRAVLRRHEREDFASLIEELTPAPATA